MKEAARNGVAFVTNTGKLNRCSIAFLPQFNHNHVTEHPYKAIVHEGLARGVNLV